MPCFLPLLSNARPGGRDEALSRCAFWAQELRQLLPPAAAASETHLLEQRNPQDFPDLSPGVAMPLLFLGVEFKRPRSCTLCLQLCSSCSKNGFAPNHRSSRTTGSVPPEGDARQLRAEAWALRAAKGSHSPTGGGTALPPLGGTGRALRAPCHRRAGGKDGPGVGAPPSCPTAMPALPALGARTSPAS